MTKRQTFAIPVVSAFLAAMAASTGSAAMIDFGSTMAISGENDVSTNLDVLVGAFNVGDGGVLSTTVNGVNFQSFALDSTTDAVSMGSRTTSLATFTLSTTPYDAGGGFLSSDSLYGATDMATDSKFSNLSANYRSLLQSATITPLDNFTLTISGLVDGQLYEFQAWVNNSRPGGEFHTVTTGPTFESTAILLDNNSGADGGVGDYVIGTFLALGDTQEVTFSPAALGASAQLNAFQLRTIPEPSTVLFGLALIGTCFGGRRRLSAATPKL